ncbi:MAG: enoyl-CoA hydratase-related protein [Pseudomonadota bacterium]
MAGEITLAKGPVSVVTLSHPGRLNAMSRAMWRSLRTVFEDLQASSGVRCVVVLGEGGNFCAGGDISEYPSFRFSEDALRDFHENDVWGGLAAMLACDVTLVAQIEGNCMGAGMEIASCCDMRLAGISAKFGAPIAKLGFPMAPREAALVASAAGALTAKEMLLSAAVLDAAEMHARGFLNRTLPDAALAEEALALAQRVARLAPEAARANKQTFRALKPLLASAEAEPDATQNEANLIAGAYRYANSAEHREGITAFLEKRPPAFDKP